MYAHARCRRRGIRCESGTVPQRCTRVHPYPYAHACSVRDPADSVPGRPVRAPDVRVSRSGPVDATPPRARVLPPALRKAPAERGRAPRDHRARRTGLSHRAEDRRSRDRVAAHPDRADRRSARRRPRPGRRRGPARPVRPGRRRDHRGAARAGHGGGRRPDLRGPRVLEAGRPAADDRHRRGGRLPGRHVVHRVGRRRPPRGPDRRPHRRVRARPRGPPRRADRHRGRRPLRLLRTAHPAQPLPAAAPSPARSSRRPSTSCCASPPVWPRTTAPAPWTKSPRSTG